MDTSGPIPRRMASSAAPATGAVPAPGATTRFGPRPASGPGRGSASPNRFAAIRERSGIRHVRSKRHIHRPCGWYRRVRTRRREHAAGRELGGPHDGPAADLDGINILNSEEGGSAPRIPSRRPGEWSQRGDHRGTAQAADCGLEQSSPDSRTPTAPAREPASSCLGRVGIRLRRSGRRRGSGCRLGCSAESCTG